MPFFSSYDPTSSSSMNSTHENDESGSGTLSPLPLVLRQGLTAVAILGTLSFVFTSILIALLTLKFISWRRKRRPIDQFVVLIFNLLVCDFHQALAFMLNTQWLTKDAIDITHPTCWAQAFFVSTGDMGGGVWCMVIGLHTLMDVGYEVRLSSKRFFQAVAAIWCVIELCTIVPPLSHPRDAYVRAGVWCWINHKYGAQRLWTHYFWIFVAEFGNILTYSFIFFILHYRVRYNHFSDPSKAARAKKVAKLMVLYPLVYVVCTLPLASARMASMRSQDVPWEWFCLGGAMITSNGWLDVILYALTRNLGLFEREDDITKQRHGLDTFSVPWEDKNTSLFGNTTTIVANNAPPEQPKSRIASFLGAWSRSNSSNRLSSRDGNSDAGYSRESLPQHVGPDDKVKITATTVVRSVPATRLELELGEMIHRGETMKSHDSDSSFGRDDWENRSNDSKQRLSQDLHFLEDDSLFPTGANMKNMKL